MTAGARSSRSAKRAKLCVDTMNGGELEDGEGKGKVIYREVSGMRDSVRGNEEWRRILEGRRKEWEEERNGVRNDKDEECLVRVVFTSATEQSADRAYVLAHC